MTLPEFHTLICADCKKKIAASETWTTAAIGLQNPERYAQKILSVLCESCKSNIIKNAQKKGVK